MPYVASSPVLSSRRQLIVEVFSFSSATFDLPQTRTVSNGGPLRGGGFCNEEDSPDPPTSASWWPKDSSATTPDIALATFVSRGEQVLLADGPRALAHPTWWAEEWVDA